jgi:hypothetical protein
MDKSLMQLVVETLQSQAYNVGHALPITHVEVAILDIFY